MLPPIDNEHHLLQNALLLTLWGSHRAYCKQERFIRDILHVFIVNKFVLPVVIDVAGFSVLQLFLTGRHLICDVIFSLLLNRVVIPSTA